MVCEEEKRKIWKSTYWEFDIKINKDQILKQKEEIH